MHVVETNDRMLLREALVRDRFRAAYMLGDLDPAYFRYTRWFVASAEPGSRVLGVAMIYSGLRLPVLVTNGEAHALGDAIERAAESLPARIYAQVEREHDAALARCYRIDDLRSYLRMGLQREAFVMPQPSGVEVVPLGHADTADLMELYRHYPDAFFEPYQLEGGFYHGVRGARGLLAAAGVHLVSDEFEIAALGNVVTHPDERGRGLAKACMGRVLAALFERVPDVALSVPADNETAVRAFTALGFGEKCRILEGVAERRLC